jgi:hypothetical protein
MFQLAKVWIDTIPNPNTVEIRYTWSDLQREATLERRGRSRGDAGRAEHESSDAPRSARDSTLPQPQTQLSSALPLRRRRRVPRGGFDHGFTEEIVSSEVEYIDNEGRITEVRVLWSADGWSAPNWSHARLEGLQLKAHQDQEGHHAEGEGLADEAIYELVQTVPLPRRFVARVWGPMATTVEYVFQLLRTNSPVPDDDFQRWHNNQGQNYRLVL